MRHQKTKAVTAQMLKLAGHAEDKIGKWLGLTPEGHFSPVDLIFESGLTTNGIEIKALITSRRDRIYVRQLCRISKEEWARATQAVLHTVAVDFRNSEQVYYRKGIGSFNIKDMTQVTDADHLKRLLGIAATPEECPF